MPSTEQRSSWSVWSRRASASRRRRIPTRRSTSSPSSRTSRSRSRPSSSRPGAMPVSSLGTHRELIEAYLAGLPFADELGALTDAMRYSLDGGGKRIRPVLCLVTGEALGAAPDELLPAAAAVELAHTFGMVHDDLPALDDDDVRRGRPTSHVEYDEATAILNGDALLAQAFELALSYPGPEVARELSRATLGMIGGQYDDVQGGDGDLARRHSLKTGRLFEAAVGCALAVAGTAETEWEHWRGFASE